MTLDLTRRRFLIGAIAAPVVIRTAGLLMPVKAFDPIQSRGVARIMDIISEGEIAGLSDNPALVFIDILNGQRFSIGGTINWNMRGTA